MHGIILFCNVYRYIPYSIPAHMGNCVVCIAVLVLQSVSDFLFRDNDFKYYYYYAAHRIASAAQKRQPGHKKAKPIKKHKKGHKGSPAPVLRTDPEILRTTQTGAADLRYQYDSFWSCNKDCMKHGTQTMPWSPNMNATGW